MFGAKTAKPIKLISSSPFVTWLYRKLNRKMIDLKKSNTTKRYTDAAGKHRFTGTKTLKSTSVYPPRFGDQACYRFPALVPHCFI